jgi:V4R domain
MRHSVDFDPKTNLATLGGRALVFHCHHYNSILQQTIEQGLGEEANHLLSIAAQEAVRLQLPALSRSGDRARVLETAASVFSELGFGRLDFSALSESGGIVSAPTSHYALSWLAKFGERTTPACPFTAGFIAAAVSVAFDLEPERVRVRETGCQAQGRSVCHFDVEVL